MTFAALREEYERDLVGSRIYARVRDLVANALRRRDLAVYGHGESGHSDAVEEVLQDFVLEVLIRERQVDYTFAVAAAEDDFDRLISRQLRRFLARTRRRTIVDNLIDRCVARLTQPPFVSHTVAGEQRFDFRDRSSSNPMSDDSVRRASALAQAIPKDQSASSVRAPRVYDDGRLTRVLVVLASEGDGWLTRSALQSFFELLLTPWIGSVLEETEGSLVATSAHSPEELVLIMETATRIADALNDEGRAVVLMKMVNLPDRVMASRLRISRPTAALRKAEALATLRTELEQLDPSLQPAAVSALSDLLLARVSK